MTEIGTVSAGIAPGPIILLLGLGLLGLVCFAVVKRKWGLLLIPSGLLVLVFPAVLSLRDVHKPDPAVRNFGFGSQSVDQALSHVERSIAPEKPDALPSVWSEGIEEEFEADVYYSKRAALRGIAGQVDKMVRQSALNGQSVPENLAVVTYKDQFGKDLLDEAVEVFQDMLPDTECYKASAGKESFTKNDAWVFFELTESAGQPSGIGRNGLPVNSYLNNNDFKNGQIKVSIHLKNRSRNFSVRFTEKPWLDNISAFKNSYPARQWTVAYSQSHQAGREAYDRAQIILGETISSELAAGKEISINADISISNHDLIRHGIIADRFTQSFRGGASKIRREALLLDVSPDKIESLARQKSRRYNMARQSWAYHLFSAIGVAIAICAVYLILNAATRGYYTVVLRILTVIGIIVAVVVLLNFR